MLGPIAAVESAVFKSLNFTGRATRAEFWWWSLFQFLIMTGCIFADVIKITNAETVALNPLGYSSFVFGLLTMIPNLSVAIRRLHDTGRSGFWYFIVFVPFVGGLWFLVLMVLPSERDDNYYGPAQRNGRVRRTGTSKARHDPMQGYACLDRLHDEPSEEMQVARKQEVRDYYRARVLQTQ
ncbi:Uncharacterized membrane protein YhaH, DUF805 family [Shimia gijangensis]|uniref:Uncharacterized membrane protein YhaH, DUF805 family n=1 Tax=Shimia gijangensis TaxID=1470563 RepID=A0A1M6FBG3_9RHOB|nr:DUF805 domain-containing protein [Shimia gijangensis]SHI95084.1 Uncharacterized membrane protein YhaH, DUF805 family [Shimia gijangensis]